MSVIHIIKSFHSFVDLLIIFVIDYQVTKHLNLTYSIYPCCIYCTKLLSIPSILHFALFIFKFYLFIYYYWVFYFWLGLFVHLILFLISPSSRSIGGVNMTPLSLINLNEGQPN
jgi:hypothetical protein